MRITGVLLAAGRAERFGGDKLLARFGEGPHAGTPIGVVSWRNLREAIDDVVVAVRASDEALRRVFDDVGAHTLVAPRADEGLGATICAAVEARATSDGYVFALGDMPYVLPSTIARVAEALARGASMAAPRYEGRRGHPVGFSSVHREALSRLTGDEGARSIVEQQGDALVLLEVDDPGIVRDIDVPQRGIVPFRARP